MAEEPHAPRAILPAIVQDVIKLQTRVADRSLDLGWESVCVGVISAMDDVQSMLTHSSFFPEGQPLRNV